MTGDASAYEVRVVISHFMPDVTKRPIAYASRTVTRAEPQYAQVEKESLSLMFVIRKFRQYPSHSLQTIKH